MAKENHYADSHPERKPNGVPRHKSGKKGRNREASYKQDDPDSHNDICKHKDPDPDDPGNPEEAQTMPTTASAQHITNQPKKPYLYKHRI